MQRPFLQGEKWASMLDSAYLYFTMALGRHFNTGLVHFPVIMEK